MLKFIANLFRRTKKEPEKWVCRGCWRFMPRALADGLPPQEIPTMEAYCAHCGKASVFFALSSPEGTNFGVDLIWEAYEGRLKDAGY